jgi:ABC-type dipeptide/oligopeptide/nickel transport system ATPase subunit
MAAWVKVLFDNKPVARECGSRTDNPRTDKLTTRIRMVHQDPLSSLTPGSESAIRCARGRSPVASP